MTVRDLDERELVRKFRMSWILIFLVVLLFSGKVNLERYISSPAMEEVSPRKVVYWLAQSHSEEAVLGGYSFGALIMEETGHVDEAISFLDEGIENNPYAFELRIYRDFMIRLFKTHEYEKAIKGRK